MSIQSDLTVLKIYLHYFSVEAEFATKEKELTERHAAEIAALESGGSDEAEAAPAEASTDNAKDEPAPAPAPTLAPAPAEATEEEPVDVMVPLDLPPRARH